MLASFRRHFTEFWGRTIHANTHITRVPHHSFRVRENRHSVGAPRAICQNRVAHNRQYALPVGGLRGWAINDLRSAYNDAADSRPPTSGRPGTGNMGGPLPELT